MKKMILLALSAITMLLSYPLMGQEQTSREMTPGEAMPQWVLQSDVHGELSSADLKGKVVLMTFFTTWCGPCQQELAAVQEKLWPKFKDEKGFRLVAVGREHDDEALKVYNGTKNFTFPMYPDPKREVYSKFADITIPRVYLFGKDGKLIHASKGYDAKHFDELMKMIEEAL